MEPSLSTNPPPVDKKSRGALTTEAAPSAADDVFVFDATLAQRRFWLLDQLQPRGNPALNMSIALHWHGPFDPILLRDALNQVVQRHEALRTTFANDRGSLQQLIAPLLSLDVAVTDAAELPEIAPADLPRHIIERETQRPFDLEHGPLLRARILRIASSEHLLVLVVHHIISDGWSNGILTRDLCACYTASASGTRAELPGLPLQFADYAEWQQTRLTNGDFAEQLDRWRSKLTGNVPGLDLPYDRPRRVSGDIAGDVRSIVVPAELAAAAKALAARENASPFMLFFAVFQALLHRYTRQTDFLVTTPSANRERLEFESVVGLFVNPLLIRADLNGSPTFVELLGRVRRTALEAFSHQEVPFESLLDQLQAARLQVNFHYDSGLQQSLDLPSDVTVEMLPAVSTGTVYELSVSVLEESGRLRLEFEYNTALFDAATIERMQRHYETLLRSAVSHPTMRVSELALLSPDEERRSTADPHDAAVALNVRARLAELVMEKPDAMMARHGRRELSCAELLARLEAPPTAENQTSAPSNLERMAARIANWRARLDGEAPLVRHPRSVEDAIAAASLALFKRAELREGERIASSSPPGFGASEEIGAALLAHATLVYPTADLLTDSAAALVSWLEAESITVAFFSAATWNRILHAIATRKVRMRAKLRLVIVTDGDAAEGSFGRVSRSDSIQVWRRAVVDPAGGTIALDGTPVSAAAKRLRVLDRHSDQLSPVGTVGELAVQADDGRYVRTGELARRLPDESFDFLGSAQSQRYARGIRVEHRLTETALCAVPGIWHAVVQPSETTVDAALVAYILPDAMIAPPSGRSAFRALLREQRLADLAMPETFVVMRDIPLRGDDGGLDLATLDALRASSRPETDEPVRPYLGLQLQLIAIWEEVLGVREIGIRDDFFDLGGNSLLAMRMLQRAEVACGKAIPPATLFRNPTIEKLAGEIARGARDESPPVLRVHDAGTRTPFFYLHGDLSGGGFYSLKLSRALGPEQPFYVLPPQDIRTLSAAPSIEEMATAHLEALRAVRPHGPYVVGGFCIGGLVAYELAQQIRASGEKVEMLLIIDAAPDRLLRALQWTADAIGSLCRWDGEVKLAHFGRWTVWQARIAHRLASRQARNRQGPARSIGRRSRQILSYVRRRFGAKSAAVATSTPTTPEEERDLPSAFRWASAAYRPQLYDGPVALLLSEDVARRADNVARAWQQLAPRVTLHPLQGSHLECITEHVEALAAKIEDRLEHPPSTSAEASAR